jgi:hypothetical protein
MLCRALSSVEHDYLTDGFWAMTRKDELAAGFNVSFLQRIDDVTEQVNARIHRRHDRRGARDAKIGEIARQQARKKAARRTASAPTSR